LVIINSRRPACGFGGFPFRVVAHVAQTLSVNEADCFVGVAAVFVDTDSHDTWLCIDERTQRGSNLKGDERYS
jgi:hypothetical protein